MVKKDIRHYMMGALIILIALLLIISLINKKVYSFEIEDKCGRFMNLMQHTIESEPICKTRCASQCHAMDYNFKKVEFEQGITSCNKCVCYCKE